MTALTVYDSLDLFDKLAYAIRKIILRQKPEASGNRSYVLNRAQERFDYIVEGGDLINLAPVRPGEKLVNVQPDHHERLRELGAQERDGSFYMPMDLDDEEVWKFKDWFPRAPEDLESIGLNWHLTRDGRPTNGYIDPEDLVRGHDSTATSLLMGAFPVLFAASYTLYQFGGFGQTAAMAAGGGLLALHSYALYQAEGAGTLAKLLAISGGVPLLASGLAGTQYDPMHMAGSPVMVGMTLAAVVGLVTGLANTFKATGRSGLFSIFSKIKHVMLAVGAVYGLNLALNMLPSWLDWVKPLGWWVVACSYPLYYTLGNYKTRTTYLELLDKRGLGSTNGSATMLGKRAPIRMQQIRSAFRDKSPFMELGTALGVQARYGLAIAPDKGQKMGLSFFDSLTHIFIFGLTGKGKTAATIRKYMLELSKLRMKIGALVADGKWALVADTRAWFDLIIEPGIKFAPFQGMTALQVARAFAEANAAAMHDKDSIWSQGAEDTHRYAGEILEALVAHEKVRRASELARLEVIEPQIVYWCAEKIKAERAGGDTTEIDACLANLEEAADRAKAIVNNPRQYRWTPDAYLKLINTVGAGVTTDGKNYSPSPKALALFDYLGFKHSEERGLLAPETIHPSLADSSRVLSNALFHFTETWFKGKTQEQRQSFLLNVDKDLQGFFQNDELRGSTINGVNCGDEAWSHTEEGEDVMQCLYGKKIGLNLSTRYGKTAKVILKLIQMRVYDAVQERGDKYGDNWREATGQTEVVCIQDECQDLVSPVEVALAAKARSLGLSMVFATQTFEGLSSVLPSDGEKIAFLSSFRTRILWESSERTYEFIQGIAGRALKKVLPVSVQATTDVSRSLDALSNSIHQNRSHPSAHALRDMSRRGATRLQVVVNGVRNYMGLSRRIPIEELEERNFIEVHSGGEYKEGPILEMTDMTATLMEEGNALLFINRANQPRIDYARMEHISAEEFGKRLKAINARKEAEARKVIEADAAKTAITVTH